MFGLRQAAQIYPRRGICRRAASRRPGRGAERSRRHRLRPDRPGQVRGVRVCVEFRRRGRSEGGGDERLCRQRWQELRRARLVSERLRRSSAGSVRHGAGKERDVAGPGGSARPADLRGRRGVRLRRGGFAMRQPRRAGPHMVGQRERPRGAGSSRACPTAGPTAWTANRPAMTGAARDEALTREQRIRVQRGRCAREAGPATADCRDRCRSRRRHVRAAHKIGDHRQWQQAKGLGGDRLPDTRRGRGARGRAARREVQSRICSPTAGRLASFRSSGYGERHARLRRLDAATLKIPAAVECRRRTLRQRAEHYDRDRCAGEARR